jgi:hypothetical protein
LFNDHCANVAELRALIANARTLAIATAEQRPKRAVAAQLRRSRILTRLKRPGAARVAGGDERSTSEPERLAA